MCLLILAFAQPVIRDNDSESEIRGSVVIYLDNSPSQQIQVDGESNFDRGVKMAQSIVNFYPQGTKFRFIENSYSNSPQINYTREALSDLLTEVNLVNVGRSLEEISDRISTMNLEGDVYMISDFNSLSEVVDLEGSEQYHILALPSADINNIFVDSVYLENSYLSGSFSNQLNILLRSDKVQNVSSIARVYFNEKLSGTISIDIENFSGNGVYVIPDDAGSLENVSIVIDDSNISFDNDFYLSINSLKRTNVLEMFSGSSSAYINELFSDNEFFNFNRSNVNQIDIQAFQNADFIILNGVPQYTNQLINEVENALERGATVVVVPSRDFSPAQLMSFGARVVGDDNQRITLQVPDYADPFYDGVFEVEEPNIQMPYASTDFRLLNVEYSLLDFLNGRPFLSKVATPNNLYIFSTPFDTDRTNFTNHSLFVPVFYRLALGSKSVFDNLFYYTDSEVINFPLLGSTQGKIYQLKNNELEITPDQRESGAELIMYVPKDQIESGNYALKESETTIGHIAFNLPKTESMSSPTKNEILDQLSTQENVSIWSAESESQLSNELRSELLGTSLWKGALLLALLFLFVEIILIRYL